VIDRYGTRPDPIDDDPAAQRHILQEREERQVAEEFAAFSTTRAFKLLLQWAEEDEKSAIEVLIESGVPHEHDHARSVISATRYFRHYINTMHERLKQEDTEPPV